MAEHHDDEPKLLTPDAPADTLHAHVEKHISLPDAEKFENEPLMNELTSHPNLASHSIEKLYGHMMEGSSQELADQGHSEPYSHEWAENLLTHPNAPAHIKKDYLKRTFHPDNPASDTHEKLADQGVATDDELRELSDKVFKSGETPHTYSQLHPDYYMQHFKEGSQSPEAQEGIASYGLEGLLNSKKHTPESLDRLIDAVHANKYHNYDAENDKTANNAELLARVVRERGDLSKGQLNRISQMLDSTHDEHRYSKDDAIEEILKHTNVDPSLLAKYATAKDATESALSHPNLPKQSMDAFVRRVKTPNDYSQRSHVNAFLSNPSITKEHVQKLITAGSKDAVHHHLADEQSVRDAWNGSSKSTDDARNILSAKNIPPDILKDLVHHKNQDVAVQALNHPKADMEVVESALSRKAKTVQDAARLHPLVADQQAREGLTSGKTSLSKVYDDGDFQEHFDRMPKKQQDEIFTNAHQKYTGTDLAAIAKSTKERPETVLHSKLSMAMDSRVSPEIREKQSKDIVSMFKKNVGANKEIEAKRSHILNEGHDDHSRLVRAVAQMAEAGDEGAQAAILSNPAMTQGLSGHVDLDEAPPKFLENAYRQAVKYGARPPNIYDRHGRPQKFDSSDVIAPLFRSKNLSTDMFHEIATNKDMMEQLKAGDELTRYDELPENEQKQRYTEILNSGSNEAAKSVLQTKAPKEIYDRALSMLSPEDRNQQLGEHMGHVSKHRPDLMHAAALGQYNETEHNGNYTGDAQSKALGALDQRNVNDVNIMKQALSIPPDDSVRHITDDRFLNANSAMMQRDDMIQHAIQAGRTTLAHKALGRKVRDEISEARLYGDDKQARAQEIATDLQHRANTMPSQNEMTDNPVASNWNDLINNSKDRYSSYGGRHDESAISKLADAGANLDFLGSMPGREGEALRRTALKHNLLSDEAVSHIAKTGSLRDVLSIANGSVKRLALDSWLEKPDLSEQDLSDLAEKMSHGLLNSDATTGGRSTSMSSHAYDEYQRKLNSIIDKVSEKAPDNLNQVIRNALGTNGDIKELTKSDSEKIAKAVTEHVASKAYATPTARNRAMYDTYKALNSKELVGPKDKQRLENQILESKDYETLVNMAEERNLSDKGMDALAKAARQPELLSSSEIAGLSTRLNNTTEPQTVVNMAKTFETKLAQEAAAGNTRNQTANKIKFLGSVGDTFNATSNSTEEDKAKNEFVINYTKKLALDPAVAPHANSQLLKISANLGRVDMDKGLDLMASLPESRDAFHDFRAPSISKDFANNPRFMEMAQSGWKLQTLVEAAHNLTGSNSSILVNRALSESGIEVNKLNLLGRLEENEFVQAEDSIKLGRSLDHKEFDALVNDISDATSGNLVYVAHARLQDVDALAKDPNLAAHGAPHMGHEHRNAIMDSLHSMSKVVKASVYTQEMTNKADKLDKIGQIIDSIHDHTKAVTAALRDESAKSGYNMDIGSVHAKIKQAVSNISETEIKLDRDQAIKAFDMVNEFHSLDKAAKLDLTKPEDTFSIVQNLVEKSENLEDQDWRDVFQKAPHAIYGLSKRSSIPTSALASVDYNAIEKAPADDDGQHGMFAAESGKWFEKMSSADRATHGKALMDMYMNMQAEGKLSGVQYSKPMLEAIPHMAAHMSREDVQNMMVATKSHDIAQSLFRKAVEVGAGGEETLRMYVRDHKKIMGEELFKNVKDFKAYQSGQLAQSMEPVLKSPHINDDISGRVCAMFVSNPDAMESAMNKMLENKATPQSAVHRMADQVMSNAEAKHSRFDESMGLSIAAQLLQHPNIDEARFMKLGAMSNEEYGRYIAPESQFNPALMNPTHGGKLFRSMPVVVPEVVPNVDGGKIVTSLNVKSDEYNKMRDIMGLIPAEGMPWAEFKKKFPQQEKSLPKSVRDVFMAAQNKPVMPEQFATAMRSLDDNASKYHITFSHWSSPLQRHRGQDQKPNLVVQINNSAEKEQELSRDPKLWALYQHLLQDANGVDAENNRVGLHPTTPHLVSWSRVDTDQSKGHWVIEEYQSDFAQKFRANLNALVESSPTGMKLNGQAITGEDMKNYSKIIGKHVEDWADASMQAVIQNAKAQGIKKLYMHGAEVRGAMSSSSYTREFWDNKNTRPQTSGFRKIYEEGPRKYGFEECDYTDYPKYSTERLEKMNAAKLSTKCWVLNLDAPDQRPKKKKA